MSDIKVNKVELGPIFSPKFKNKEIIASYMTSRQGVK